MYKRFIDGKEVAIEYVGENGGVFIKLTLFESLN